MSEHGETSLGRALVDGSEEDFDVICDPCNSEGQRIQATGHCIDCNENMCFSCMNFHKKLAAIKDHVIKDKSTLSHSQKARTKVNTSSEDKDPMIDRCPKHRDELIKFYCNIHHSLGCSDCISLDHRSCKDISYIKDVSCRVSNSDELIKIQADLQMLIARLTSTQSRAKWIKQIMSESYSQTVSDIINLKKEIIEMLDQFEIEILDEASLMNKENTEALDSTVSACDSAIRNIEKFLADIEKKIGMSHNNQLFISMKNAQSRILTLADEADELCNRSKYVRLSFQPDEQLKNLLSTLTSLGEMILVRQNKDVLAEYQGDVTFDTNTEDYGINAIIVLPDGRLALSDGSYMSVKLVDVTKSKVVEQMEFDTKPLDLACMQDDTIVLTLSEKPYIQVLSVTPALSKIRTIAVPGFYLGIEYITDKFILICRPPISEVHICDMSGTVLQQIETDFWGNKLISGPSRIAISPDRGIMYVSDVDQHTVVCLTMEGKLIRKYANDSLKRPVGLAVDDSGYVYVCSRVTNTVHQLSPSGKLVKVLLDEKDEIISPCIIAYRDGNLYIGSYKTSGRFIKSYRLQN